MTRACLPLAFYVSTDTSTNIDPGTSPLAFDTNSLTTGLGAQLDTKYLLSTGTFTEVANGHIELFTFTPSGAARSLSDDGNRFDRNDSADCRAR